MKIIILIFACLTLVGAQEEFEVKELKPADVQELQRLEKRVEDAAGKLAEAQRVFNEAKSEKDSAVHRIKVAFGATLFGCMGGWQERVIDTKRVEVRGKYALITVSKETCGSNIILTPAYVRDGTTTLTQDSTTTLRGPVEVK